MASSNPKRSSTPRSCKHNGFFLSELRSKGCGLASLTDSSPAEKRMEFDGIRAHWFGRCRAAALGSEPSQSRIRHARLQVPSAAFHHVNFATLFA